MKTHKKILSIIVAMISLALLLSGCGSKKTIHLQNIISASSLEAEPANWISEEAIDTLIQANLPADLQQSYMDLIRSGYKEVILLDPEGWQIEVNSNENGVFLGSGQSILKFFQSSSGNVVEIGKIYRTLTRSEFFNNEDQKAYDSFELDYLPTDSNLIKVAVTNDFSVMYNTKDNTYQCMRYREVIGTSPVSNWDAVIQPKKTPTAYGANKGFIYNKEWYIPVIDRVGETVTFSVVKEADLNLDGNPSFSYVPMKIGTLEVNACEIVH